MSVSKKLNTIKKYKNIILEIQNKINEIFNDIKLLMLQTNFVQIKTANGKSDFLYILNIHNIENKWYITGIRYGCKKDIEIGVIDIEYIKDCKDIISIEPYIFFNKIKKLNIDWNTNEITQSCIKHKPTDTFDSDSNFSLAVGYCRLSQKRRANTYNRQTFNISSKSIMDGYKVDIFFCEALSGDIPFNKRKEILSLIEYCSLHNIYKVYVSEFNRLGRSTKTILDGISFLRKNGIKTIHCILENVTIDEDYIKNNYKDLISLCNKSEEDRQNIVNRLSMGLKAYKDKLNKGEEIKPLGRSVGFRQDDNYYKEKYYKDIELLIQGVPYRQINTITGTSLSTIKRLNARFKCNNKRRNCCE
jgi:DNA invertase Pin-like site-specific DNA recombinase